MTGSIGTELQQARERAHLSLHDLSARTKIRAALLSAIEREEFDRLPAGLLTRGFLRAYAREVGLDPESVVRQYVAEFEPDRLPHVETRPEPHAVEWAPPASSRTRWTLLAPAIPLALAAVFFLRVHRPVEVIPAATLTPVGTAGAEVDLVAVEETVETVARARVDGAEDVPPPPPTDRLRLEIHPTAPVWIEAAVDGTPVLYELVEAGDRRAVDADEEIVLRVGDAAAFAYSINGSPGRALGGPGEVRDVRITRDAYETFLIRN